MTSSVQPLMLKKQPEIVDTARSLRCVSAKSAFPTHLLTFSKSDGYHFLSVLKPPCISSSLLATGSMWAPQTRVDTVLLKEVKLLEGSSR